MQGTRWWNCGADSIEAHEQNLEELQLDYVDLLLVHFPPLGGCGPLNCMQVRDQWSALQQLYE